MSSSSTCSKCKKRPAVEGRKWCLSCAERHRAYVRKHKSQPEHKEKLLARHRAIMQRSRARQKAGLPAIVTPVEFHDDHIIPLSYLEKAFGDIDKAHSVGNQSWNIRRIPAYANDSKGSKMLPEAWDLCREHGIPIVAW